jgi:lactoylglutathione lyase
MLPLRGVYEIAIRVKDLARAETFYRNSLGLELGIRDEKRNWVFLRVGGSRGMVVLQEDKGEWPLQHFAFAIDEADLDRAASWLQEQGVEVSGPVYHQWMHSKSLYFADPDGHSLELCAPAAKA